MRIHEGTGQTTNYLSRLLRGVIAERGYEDAAWSNPWQVTEQFPEDVPVLTNSSRPFEEGVT